jgi:hypothetical protein
VGALRSCLRPGSAAAVAATDTLAEVKDIGDVGVSRGDSAAASLVVVFMTRLAIARLLGTGVESALVRGCTILWGEGVWEVVGASPLWEIGEGAD